MGKDYVASTEQSPTTTYSRTQFRCFKLSYLLKFISSAAIPLMIGIITLSLAIHQQKVAQSNRDNDAALAAKLRKQDLDQGRLQREEDERIAQLQRTEDKEMVRLQRESDLKIANNKRLQDNDIAEEQRTLSEIYRTQESELAQKIYQYSLTLEDERQKESVLFEYQNDLATLLLDHESMSNETTNTWWFVLQMKTGTALRQLDPRHRTILVQTLLEADLLDVKVASQNALLYTANLSGVQFSQSVLDVNFGPYQRINKPFIIPRADLRYASFYNAQFSETPSFTYSNLDYTDWSFTYITNVFFRDDMSMNEAKFYGSRIYGTHFDGYRSMEINFHRTIKLHRASFEYNVGCIHCLFRRVSLLGIRLNHSKFIEAKFLSLSMADGNLSNGSFTSSTFDGVTLDRVDLSGANLRSCKFIAVSMVDCFMFGTKFQQILFSQANLTGCKGLNMRDRIILDQINFHQTFLPNGTFTEGNRWSI